MRGDSRKHANSLTTLFVILSSGDMRDSEVAIYKPEKKIIVFDLELHSTKMIL